jgi:rhamnopyranosyl-N-acetylglucosaminyl-diphospho-decaprenol beta-1,3/1,4-galactofuranosyltransferase
VTVAAIIPTRTRLDGLQAAVAALRAQTRPPDAILVIDNKSRDGTAAWLALQDDLVAHELHGNGGAPGGFQAGIDAALAAGHDWIWLIDDDCVPDPHALDALLAVTAGERVGGAVPTVSFGDAYEQTGSRVLPGSGETPVRGPRPGEDVDWAPFAGLLLAAPACRAAGPLKDWFLWYADLEYGLRLRLAGWRLPAAPDARVWHPLHEARRRRIGPKTFEVAFYAPWREYYEMRNRILARRALAGTRFDARPPLPRRIAKEVTRDAAILLADPAGPRRLLMRALGLLDGRRGCMDRHPEGDPRWA